MSQLNQLPPSAKTVIPPPNGWEDQTYYVVEVAHRTTNPIHRAILYVGFIPNKPHNPLAGGYTTLWSATYGQEYNPMKLHYLKFISKIEGL
jgi:hypothetical protein